MVFSSQLFVFWFLPAALLVYYGLFRAPRAVRHGALTLLSYLFYGWANPPFMVLMAASTAVDYLCGRRIASEPCPEDGPRSRGQRTAVTISIVSNLGLLGFFKYSGFALDQYNAIVDLLGLSHLAWRDFLRVTLPLGISFYTFQSMSYTIDVYRGHAKASRSPIDFACYVSLFSQLVAGPIIRYSEIAKQLEVRTHDVARFARGTALFCLGMGKKVLLANPAGKVADTCFDAGSVLPLDAWLGAFAYAFQIYFDFSGYSDMAIGLGLMLGFVFPKNFDGPYHSRSITEFWRRWHISLSSWLRDYLYLPLGGNRHGPRRTYVNLALVMLLGGLWHGASLNFLVWGGLHGGLLAYERWRGRRAFYAGWPAWAQTALTFGLVTLGWVFFRASDLGAAVTYLGHMVGIGEVQEGAALVGAVIYQPYYLLSLAAAALVTWTAPQAWDFTRRLTPVRAVFALAVLWVACTMLFTQSFNPFIYFIF